MLPVSKNLCASRACDKAIEVHCGGCHLLGYCSVECQKNDWATHKQFCKVAAEKNDAPPPFADPIFKEIRAILFDPEAPWGGTILLKYSMIRPGYMKIDLGNCLAVTQEEEQPCLSVAPGYFDITRDSAYEVDLPYTIRVHYRDDLSRSDEYEDDDEAEAGNQGAGEMKVNKSMMEMLGMPQGHVRQWRGPIVAYGIESFTADSHPRRGTDLRDEDARIITNYFRIIQDPIKMVRCVRVNYDSDVHKDGRLKYEAIKLPAQHAIFNQQPTPISSRVGLPITVARIPGSVDFWERREGETDVFHPNVNQAVTFLHLGIDPEDDGKGLPLSATWGFAPWTWDTLVGSCIVARKDKKPLLPGHVALLSDYCYSRLIPSFEKQKEDDLEKNHVLNQISKTKFKGYLHAWRALQNDDNMRTMISPYKVGVGLGETYLG